jgi:hypothetical protein
MGSSGEMPSAVTWAMRASASCGEVAPQEAVHRLHDVRNALHREHLRDQALTAGVGVLRAGLADVREEAAQHHGAPLERSARLLPVGRVVVAEEPEREVGHALEVGHRLRELGQQR